ncbi:MAG: hypothetical protein ISS70_26850 [Phycisphaerae bacterium]|nr:hypothetical protein [Phycisphaerae bacterium]
MDTPGEMLKQYANEIRSHRKWLQSFDEGYVTKWEKLLKADPEAAICEAATRELLERHDVTVRPNEDLSVGGPDYLCTRGRKHFYLEVTCISKDAATRVTKLPDKCPSGPESYTYMTNKILRKLSNKASQCAGMDGPTLVALCTLHSQAGDLCFDDLAAEELLIGITYITHDLDNETHEPVGNTYDITRLEGSAFIRPVKASPNWIEHVRNPVSAILLCGFGSFPPSVMACLHPSPNYPFDQTLLPQIKFCRLVEGYLTGPPEVEWI